MKSPKRSAAVKVRPDHVGLSVADLDALMDDLRAKDVCVARDIAVHDGTRCAFVRDNTGNLVEFVERKQLRLRRGLVVRNHGNRKAQERRVPVPGLLVDRVLGEAV